MSEGAGPRAGAPPAERDGDRGGAGGRPPVRPPVGASRGRRPLPPFATGHRPWPAPEQPWTMWQVWHDLLFAHWPIDPEARLWSIFMLVQSLPFVAAVVVSVVNAMEQMRHARAIYETTAAPVVATAAMQPAQ